MNTHIEKLKVDTSLEIDGKKYDITITPTTKKQLKEYKKKIKEIEKGKGDALKASDEIEYLKSDLSSIEELIEASSGDEKVSYLKEKRSVQQKIKKLESDNEEIIRSALEENEESIEKLMEKKFDNLVGGKDKDALKEYVSSYSFSYIVGIIEKVYEDELMGNSKSSVGTSDKE